MSKKRKEEIKKEKRKKKIFSLTLISVLIVFTILGLFFVYSKFFIKKGFESFVPAENSAFFLVNINPESDQAEILKKLGLRFGEEKFFKNFLNDLIFPELREKKAEISDELMFGWRGNFVALGNIKLSATENIPIFIIEVKNPPLASNFLKILEENLQKKGYFITSENFRGHQITKNQGPNSIAYALFDQYLLISERPDGVMKMIDTRLGRFPSLAQNKDYHLTKKKLEENKSIIFGYFDLIEFIKTLSFLEEKNINEETFDKLNIKHPVVGISFIPHEDSIEAKIYSKDYSKTKKSKKTELTFAKKIPADVIFYLEGKDARPAIENLLFGQNINENDETKKALIKRAIQIETGLNFDEDLLNFLDEEYTVLMLPSSSNKKIDAALIFNIKGKSNFAEKLPKLEKATIDLLNQYILKSENEKTNFTDHNYQNVNYRYLNLPDKWAIDIGVGITSDYFFLATSEKASESTIDIISGRIANTLSQNPSFKISFESLKNKFSNQLFYCDIQSLIKFMSLYTKSNYENLDKKIKILDTISIAQEKRGKEDFYNLFLKIK